ncbi:MAG TPA: tetratricopeptide repeat protein, partial [Nannocystis exedens]|nr:tetratricopeptide repeat protein [Nannocystis exedens]
KGEFEASAAALAEAGDDRRSRLYRGWLAAARGDQVAALALARALLVDFPGDPAAALLALESDPQASLADYRRLADAAPLHPRIQEALVLALLSEGALIEADQRVEQLHPSPRASASFRSGALLFRAQLLERRAHPSRALELYDAARQRAPERQDIAIHRFRLLLATGDLAHLRREIEEIEGARVDPELVPELASLGVLLELRSGRPQEATRIVEELARRDLGGAWVPYLRGLIEREQGDVASALADFESARELGPHFVPPIIAEASILHEFGREEEGIALLARERAWAEERVVGRQLLGAEVDMLLALGRAREALEILDQALIQDPFDNGARIRRGMLRNLCGRPEAGRQDLLGVAERAGELTGLIAPLGRLYLREGAIDRARALIESRLEDRRVNPEIVLLAAEIAFAGGEVSRAEALVRRFRLRDSAPTWRGTLLEAKILEARAELAEAAALVETIEAPNPEPELEFVAGRIFEANGDLEGAIVRYRRAAHYQPASAEIALRLAQALALREQRRQVRDSPTAKRREG